MYICNIFIWTSMWGLFRKTYSKIFLFTKNRFLSFQCFPFIFDNIGIRYTLRGVRSWYLVGFISLCRLASEVRALLPHPSRKRTATYINDEHKLILGHSKKCRKLCILTVISSEMILPYKRSWGISRFLFFLI